MLNEIFKFINYLEEIKQYKFADYLDSEFTKTAQTANTDSKINYLMLMVQQMANALRKQGIQISTQTNEFKTLQEQGMQGGGPSESSQPDINPNNMTMNTSKLDVNVV